MDLPPELRIIHEPVRLRIMNMLYRQNDLGFGALRAGLDVTAGNLSSHATRLSEAGFLTAREALTREGFEKRYQITKDGVHAFERYLAAIESFLEEARAVPAPPPVVVTASPSTAPASTKGTIIGAAIGGAFFLVSELAVQMLADTTGSAYVGIGATALVITAIAPLRRFFRR